MRRVLDSQVMLRLIDRYLIREIVPYLLLSLLLLTAIIFFHEASRFSELFVVASRNGLPMQALSRLLAALVPGILVFTLPISLLMGVLVGMGRMSGDSEIVALGASGLPRTRMLRPVMLVALVVTALMLYLTFSWLPRSVRQLTDLKSNQSLVFQGLNTEIKPRVFEESIPQKVLYIEDIDRARNQWRNVFLVDLGQDTADMTIVTANSGALRQGVRSDMPELFLEKGMAHQTARATTPDADADAKTNGHAKEARAQAATEATPPAGAEGEGHEKKKKNVQEKYTTNSFTQMTVGIEAPADSKEDMGLDREATAVEEMTWGQLINFTPPPADERPWRAEIHRRLALPTACLIFALLGVAFGISNVRTGRSFGLFLGLAFTISYYLLALSGQHAAVVGKLPVWLGIWQANIVMGALGLLVLALQRRPGADPLALLRSLRYLLPARNAQNGDAGNTEPAAGRRPLLGSPLRRAPRLRLLQLLDRLVLSDLSRFFVFILAGVSALFLIITLFQLLDAIARNHTDWAVVVNYLVFLLPMIVNYVTPMAALVAVMVTFGLLQKTSQVVALTASGQSIYRLALPALLGSLVLSAFVFFNQDYVLPFTNSRQNNLRYLIRKGQEPPQTFYQTTNQWLFGQESRIFNYAYFDVSTNAFARLNVIDLTREPFGIKRRLYARRARWDAATSEWVLENGWERRFNDERTIYYSPFKEQRVQLAEGPDYFKKDIRSTSSLTLAELKRKIADLQQAGFDVLDLRIALQSKIAFPLACLVMVIVALPFAFSVGKRGALYGVAIGIAIGLVYWGMLSLFEQMGRYEMLPPLLAAWGPNMLFGAGGLYLFLTSRT
ncbi:MAG TPA: LptF/LptG family permease [Blastocatellia bacterium]|nr:LptF/LptG family permease [Blastocatellia bacterium]